LRNIFVHFCSTLMLATFAVGAWAEGPPETVQRYTSVVRPDNRSGKLVRSMVLTSRPVAEKRVDPAVIQPRVVTGAFPSAPEARPLPVGIPEAVERIAAENSLPAELIHSVIRVESNYDPYAVSNKGALGIMQLIPETARRFGVKSVFNPVENIQG